MVDILVLLIPFIMMACLLYKTMSVVIDNKKK